MRGTGCRGLEAAAPFAVGAGWPAGPEARASSGQCHTFELEDAMQLSAIHIHPVKSCRPLALESARVEPRGLAHDRRFLVVDDVGRGITGRQLPRMVLLEARPVAAGLALAAPGADAITVPIPEGNAERVSVTVWKDTIDAAACVPEADAWVSRVLGRPLRLVYMDALSERPIEPDYARPGEQVSFADAYPMLLLSRAAMDDLNARVAARRAEAGVEPVAPLPITRFRPNLVIDGATPHAEDAWRRIRIGGLELELVKRCTRCVFTTVDTARGDFDPSGEPLETLKDYRRSPKGIVFGQNVIARQFGEIRVGDAVHVLE